MLRWIKLSKYCAESADTVDAVDARLRAGIWLKGVHARKPEGSRELWVNLEAVNDWAEGKKPAHQHGERR
jgi:hypothetical protein